MHTELVPITLRLPSDDAPRSHGIHVSRVIRAIAGEAGILKKEYCEDLSLVEVGPDGWWDGLDSIAQLRILMGIAWERLYALILAETMGVVFHPGEMVVQGIYMTPDGEALDIIITDNYVVHEVKLTYKSVNTVGKLDTQWMWLAQLKAYCKGLSERLGLPVTVGYLHILHVCGDYSRPITPSLGPLKEQPTCWRVEFTQDEIDEGWDLIMDCVRHHTQVEAEGAEA